MSTEKNVIVGKIKNQKKYYSFIVFAVIFMLLIETSVVRCLKYSSKYNGKQLLEKINENKRKFSSNFNHYYNISNDSNKIRNIGKYVSNVYNYIKDDNAFLKTRIDLKPDYENVVFHNDNNKIEEIKNNNFVIKDKNWTKKIAECVENKGIYDCIKIFLLRRVERVNELIDRSNDQDDVTVVYGDLLDEIKKEFKWEEYKYMSDKELDQLMIKKLRNMLEKKGLKLVLRSGVTIETAPHDDGFVRLSVSRDADGQTPRGKMKKYVYRIIPFLLVPSILFFSILPLILPILKVMVVGSSILNIVALIGAIFNLLRNNIFNDEYETKVVYLNEGYKNEYLAHDSRIPSYLSPHFKKKYKRHPMFASNPSDIYEEYGEPIRPIDSEDAYSYHDDFHNHHEPGYYHHPSSHQETHGYHNDGDYHIHVDVERQEKEEVLSPMAVPTMAPILVPPMKPYVNFVRPYGVYN